MKKLILIQILVFIMLTGCDTGFRKIVVPEGKNDNDSFFAIPDNDENDESQEDIPVDLDDEEHDEELLEEEDLFPDDDDLSDEVLTESEEPDADEDDGFYDVPSDPSPIELDGVEARFHADISYGDNSLNKFDIFIARTKKPAPLVIYIHGGGFTIGDKNDA